MKQINGNLYPKGGYVFNERDGTTHAASNWAGVIARVKEYRTRQGLPVDTVEREVIHQACLRNPGLCVEDSGITQGKQREVSLRTRVLQWLLVKKKEAEKGETRMVLAPLHEARTDVCIRCPVDKSMAGGGCGACKASLLALQESIVGKRATDQRLSACPLLGEYQPVSTWLDEPAVANPALPAECWRRRSI